MSEVHLTLNDEEREYLVQVLEDVLKNKRIEEHRTRAPNYRQFVIDQEKVIEGLLGRLRAPSTVQA